MRFSLGQQNWLRMISEQGSRTTISMTVPLSNRTRTLTTSTTQKDETWKLRYMKGGLKLPDHRGLVNSVIPDLGRSAMFGGCEKPGRSMILIGFCRL